MRDSQSRKWQITINNPIEKGFDHTKIKGVLSELKSLQYCVMADEAGQTHHTHIYIVCSSALRFSTLKNKFPEAHLEIAKGSSEQNREYIQKSGKWENDKKHGTAIPGTFEEFGEMPIERQGARNDLADLYDMIKNGMSNYEIIEENPDYLLRISDIERVRQMVRAEEFKNKIRDLENIYIFGSTGLGKTRHVLEKYGFTNVYRVTDYSHPFDGYKGEDVLLFDEFHSQLPITQMLMYLEGYPTELPCRYANKQACFTKVYIISNIPFEQQYPNIRLEKPTTWAALKRRIQKVIHFGANELMTYHFGQGTPIRLPNVAATPAAETHSRLAQETLDESDKS